MYKVKLNFLKIIISLSLVLVVLDISIVENWVFLKLDRKFDSEEEIALMISKNPTSNYYIRSCIICPVTITLCPPQVRTSPKNRHYVGGSRQMNIYTKTLIVEKSLTEMKEFVVVLKYRHFCWFSSLTRFTFLSLIYMIYVSSPQ